MKKPNLNIKFYTNKIRNNTNISQVFKAYLNRGILYFKNKCYKKATEDFTYAIEISSTKGCYREMRKSYSITYREYNYIIAKIDSIVNDMENASIDLMDILVNNKK